ncbi:hypothetical protein LWC34_04900 [Kibdelosporangium philippinense]|uniref:Uncharacterized protein n=1 Tax=Kibdelosporangium philippinense TaxID=211113 RepID=A0ABS8Z2K7_9PSEU|nr:hypothetical protein [Kibdelosporangium philippinense]MCE7002168.1 hypothetical protein [Kibdelosporangium philippinense]
MVSQRQQDNLPADMNNIIGRRRGMGEVKRMQAELGITKRTRLATWVAEQRETWDR